MAEQSGVRFEGESSEYRRARDALLQAERELRRKVAEVAALRQALPDGRAVDTDYEFVEFAGTEHGARRPRTVKLSELFERLDKSLVIYDFMYPEGAKPCPMCTSFLDSFNGVALHARNQLNLAVVAKGPIEQVAGWAEERGWSNLRMLSSASNRFNRDYLAEDESGNQLPMINVFRKRGDAIHHFYTTELFFAANEPGQHPRHVDMIFPLWNVFDLTPEGRPENWFPQLSY